MLAKELKDMDGVRNKSERFRAGSIDTCLLTGVGLCRHDMPCGKSADLPVSSSHAAVFYVNVLPPLDPVRIVTRILEITENTARCPLK